MKIKLLLLSLFITGFLCAQPYLPMLEEDHTWSVDVYYNIYPSGCEPNCMYTVTQQISLGNLVTINGLEYVEVINEDGSSCRLREENGFVYRYDEDDDTERVLFDFTLEMGDTFFIADTAYDFVAYPFCSNAANSGWEDLTVGNVSYEQIAGEERKVITFNEYGYFTAFQWIEGIGNITGFDLMWEQIDITDGSLLVCFETEGINYFFNDATSCDNTTLGLEDFDEKIAILYPNPVTSTSILQFASEGVADTVTIFNTNGRLVKELPVTSDYVLLNAMEYQSGLYFYQIYSEKQLLKTEKFIVR